MAGPQSAIFLTFITISFLLDISAIILNGLIAYVMKKHSKTRIVTFWFIYCLSMSDVMVGITGLVFQLSLLVFKLDSLWVAIPLMFLRYFFQTSGHLVFIIAIDRCIHMKYLNKYSTLMNRSRARLIVQLNITFCVVTIIPYFAASEQLNALFELSLNIFRATLLVSIYFIYIKTYLSVRRQIAALKISKANKMPCPNKTKNRFECQYRTSTTQHCTFEANATIFVVHDSEEEAHRQKAYLLSKDTTVVEPQGNPFVLPTSSVTNPTLPIENEEKHDVVKTPASLSRVLQVLVSI